MTHWTNRPDTLTVFGYKMFDPETREMQVVGCKATLDAISRLGLAEPVPGTAEDVPLHAEDPQGRYRRVATGWGALD